MEALSILNIQPLASSRLVVIVCILWWCGLAQATSFRRGALSKSPFLYAGNSFPVIEYMASPGRSSSSSSSSSDSAIDEPDFLYGTDQGFRLVQFYIKAPDASLTFRDSFVRTACDIAALALAHNITIDTYAVSCTAAPALCEIQGMLVNELNGKGSTPIFVFYKPGSTDGVRLENLSAAVVLEKMDINITIEDKEKKFQLSETVSSSEENHSMRTLEELKSDIHLAFDLSLRHQVYVDHESDAPLSLEKRAVLKSWLLLIHKTLPLAWPIQILIKDLINGFAYVTKNEAYLLTILKDHQPSSSSFSNACSSTSSSHHTSDVTCGIWELIHAATVGVVEYNQLGLSEQKDHISPEAAATIIRNYVQHFGMDEVDTTASHHFLTIANNCLKTHCLKPKTNVLNKSNDSTFPSTSDWIELPLWMSKTHTEINLKIQREKTLGLGRHATLQEHMSAAWPPHRYCPTCWNSSGKWNAEAVYTFLRLEYTQIEELSSEAKQELFRLALPRRFIVNNSERTHVDLLQSSILLVAIGILIVRFVSIRGRLLATPKTD